jgi:uncharacterized protein YfaS (alpha-2-macroglobulin family)
VRAEVGKQTFQTFKVLEYRKPEFRGYCHDREEISRGGDPVPVSLKARYYFGAPVVDGKVKYRIYSRPYYRFDGDRDEDTGDDGENLFGGYADFPR